MSTIPLCPECQSPFVYPMDALLICPDCAYEWNPNLKKLKNETNVTDANGNVLEDGDDIIVIKDLKVKGASKPIKKGTKVKNIRLVDGDHDIDVPTPKILILNLSLN